MRTCLLILFTLVSYKIMQGQITDTVYFDSEGYIIIKEVSAVYRISKFDTTTGQVIGNFMDYYTETDSLIGSGIYSYDKNKSIVIQDFKGDTTHINRAIKMQNLDAVYIRINDYPELKKFIKKRPSIKDRTEMGNFVIVELNPEFPGGIENLGKFISHLLEYPDSAKKNNIRGTVKVKFMVDTDGSLKNFSILEGIGYGCDEEALRVMKLIPDWLPGLQRGKPVKTSLNMPIRFQ